METTAIKKILIVVLDNLGDAVMATAILKPLKRLYPHAQIGLWTKQYAGDLFRDQSLIDIHHACDPFWDKAPGHAKGSWKEFLRTFREIKTTRYDMALILNAEWRRSLIVCLAGIPVRIGLNRKKSRFFLTRSVPVSRDLQHFTKEHLSLVDESEDCLPRLELNSEEKRIWLEWSRKTTWEKDTYIVIHPFSGDELKTWPIDNWIQLLQELYTEGKVKRFVVICGPGEEVLLHEMVTNLPSAPLQIMAGGSLMAVKAVIGNALALVGGDSGPGHVAAALGTPVLSLFGSTNPERSRPLGHTALAVIQKNFIGSIAVGEVKEKLLALLDKKVLHV